MCGIAGELRFDGENASAGACARMAETMSPRGPDATGLFSQGRVALAHRRLKIIDLSERAQQPMVDSELGLTLVYNGAIYNYRELRRELEGLGYRFFSSGDTEVILKAFHAWGRGCVEKFAGMFAFAVHERDTGRVTLARDRLGIKPLYYAERPGRFRFASTLPAILAAGDVDTDVDPEALHHYMTFHAIVPAPMTILKGVRKLPPATVMTVEPDGARTEHEYWTLEYGPLPEDAGRSEDDWRDGLLATLRRAVERRLVADVPVGVLLSGGVDSSLITGLIAEAGHADLQTFSIGFESVGEEKGDEFEYSDIVAERFATDHHRIFIDSGRSLAELDSCIDAMSEPMVSHDAIGFYLLSEEVSKSVTVVQSGQGADEVFGGYHWYPPMTESAAPVDDYASVFFDRDHAEMQKALDAKRLEADYSRRFVEAHFAKPGAELPIDKALRIDSTVMLVDDPVKRVDNMTMAWGLEARVPFLDHEVVAFAARIPPDLKIRGDGKHVLKEASRLVIPDAVIDRPKGYFPVPALKYLRGAFLDRVRDVLHAPEAEKRGIFRKEYVDKLLQAPEGHITPLRGSKLWQVALLERWFQRHGIAA
jgi:asparagine synthase (glutamine-hydrolysing)